MSLKDNLKPLLANTIELSLRTQGYHWNVEGPDFRTYHELFQEIYEDVYGSVDPIAENIRKLSDYAPYRLTRIVELASLPENSVSTQAHDMCTDLLAALKEYLSCLNSCFEAAADENEQGIANFLSERIDACQKHAWFLHASLS